MMRFQVLIFLLAFHYVNCDLNALLAAYADESSSSEEEIKLVTPFIKDKTKPVHDLRFEFCKMCGKSDQSAKIIANFIIKENPGVYFNVTFGMKKGAFDIYFRRHDWHKEQQLWTKVDDKHIFPEKVAIAQLVRKLILKR